MNIMNLHSTLFSGMKYLDPGSGSIFLQVLLSSILGVGIYLLSRFKWIKKIIRKDRDEVDEDTIRDDLIDE